MNSFVQTSLVILALVYAVWFLMKSFGVLPKRKKETTKACGKDGCGCG